MITENSGAALSPELINALVGHIDSVRPNCSASNLRLCLSGQHHSSHFDLALSAGLRATVTGSGQIRLVIQYAILLSPEAKSMAQKS